jgi:hypothetical protein
MNGTACNRGNEEKIVAHVYSEGDTIPAEAKEGDSGVPIKGNVPYSFRSGNPIKVNVCLKWDCENRIHPMVVGPEMYSLKCIEKREE